MLLTGSFVRAIDEKQRIAIPKPFRDALSKPRGGSIYLAPNTDQSIALYEHDLLQQMADRLSQGSPAAKDVRAFRRMFYAQARRAEFDKQGRLRIPVELVSWAGIEGDVALIGVGEHLELWNAESWQKYSSHQKPRFDEVAEESLRNQ